MVRLKAFPLMHQLHTKSYRVWFRANLGASELKLHFKLEAAHPKEFAKVIFPEMSSKPQRKNELWTNTCFECFIPSADSNAYLEFNASPSGDWNLFSFVDYRKGGAEFQLESDSIPRQTVLSKSDRQVESVWSIPLTAIRQGFLSVDENKLDLKTLGVSTVLNTTVAQTYWALAHDGVKPDFHLRSSFVYALEKEPT